MNGDKKPVNFYEMYNKEILMKDSSYKISNESKAIDAELDLYQYSFPKRHYLEEYSIGKDRIENAQNKFSSKSQYLAFKILTGQKLQLNDLELWIKSNYKIFPEEERSKINKLQREKYSTKIFQFLITPLFFVFGVAVGHQKLKLGTLISLMFGSGLFFVSFQGAQIFYQKTTIGVYNELFNKYSSYVEQPEFRLLKEVDKSQKSLNSPEQEMYKYVMDTKIEID